MSIFPTGGGKATRPENIVAFNASVWSQGMEEQVDLTFLKWKGVDEERDPVDPTSLSANFVAQFPEAEILLNYHG